MAREPRKGAQPRRPPRAAPRQPVAIQVAPAGTLLGGRTAGLEASVKTQKILGAESIERV